MSDLNESSNESSNETNARDMSLGNSSAVKVVEQQQQQSFTKENGDEGNNPIEQKDSMQNNGDTKLFDETKILRDTLDLLWNQTLEQRKVCQQLEQENEYLQDYISNLMTSSNVLEK